MPFQKGHPGIGGRPKKTATIIKDFVKANPYAVETLMQILYEQGIRGDREAAQYVIDRIKGKPKQIVDQRTLNIDFTPDDYIRLLPLLEARTNSLLPAGNVPVVKLPESESTLKSSKEIE